MDRLTTADEAHLAALCNHMGRLWSEQQIEIWDEVVPSDKIEECQLTLVGKLLNNPSVNFQAFQTTMKKAWRTELVEFSQGDSSLFIIKFKSYDVKQRVLENEPWLFANHFVILKPWIANKPLYCYDFNTCAF